MTAKTYRLPDVLGGGEFEGSQEGETVGFNLPDLFGWLWLHITDVTEVNPPTPQPAPGVYDVVDAKGEHRTVVWCPRGDTGEWFLVPNDQNDDEPWFWKWPDLVGFLSAGSGQVTVTPMVAVPDVQLPCPMHPYEAKTAILAAENARLREGNANLQRDLGVALAAAEHMRPVVEAAEALVNFRDGAATAD